MLSALLERVPPQLLVVVSRSLQSLAAPLIALLISTAEGIGNEVESAISVCNVLFVGNLCASAVVLVMFKPSNIWNRLKGLSGRTIVEIVVFGSLAALLSSLIFYALETTTVTNAVLLARLGPILFAVGTTLVLGQSLTKAEWAGFGLIGVGILATVLSSGGFAVSKGDWSILGSAVVYAVVTAMSKRLTKVLDLGSVVFVRNFFSAVVFFVLANVLFGPSHFTNAFYGPLWLIMIVYALVVIVLAQLAWFRSLKLLPPATIARWTVVTPALAMAYAYFINGEAPAAQQLTALAFITVGIVVSNLGRFTPLGTADSAECSVAAS